MNSSMDSRQDFIIIEQDPAKRRNFRDSLIRRTNYRLGICEQLRMIYDSIENMEDKQLKERLTEQLVDALIMAKKMGDRLGWYYKKYKDWTGHDGASLINLTHNHTRWAKRRARTI